MKKFLALVLVLTMVFALAACGGKKDTEPTNPANPATTDPANVDKKDVNAEVPVMTHAEYDAAELNTKVCVETYVQAKQSWWDNTLTVYAQSEDGAYFIYKMSCSEEENALLTPGTKIKVTGYKANFEGEIEIADATFEILEGNYIAQPVDVTNLLGTDELINHMNEFVSFKGLTVAASQDGEGKDVPFTYKGDSVGDDIILKVSKDNQVYEFYIESYLTADGTPAYEAVEKLNIGDVVDLEGFLYWYNGANPHITSVAVAA